MSANSAVRVGLAAGLLLMGLLALSSTAAAEIVYTPVNVTISGTGSFKLDLDHDGVNDFLLRLVAKVTACGNRGGFMGSTKITPTAGDGVVVSHLNFAAVLASGAPVDGSSTFYPKKAIVTQFFLCPSGSESVSGYLGLEFQINGQTHYGWAQVNIHASYGGRGSGDMESTLLGFAYETIAGRTIEAGQTSGKF